MRCKLKKPSDLPFSLKKPVFIGVSAREVLAGDLPYTSPLDDLQHLRAVHRLYDLIFLWLAETGHDDLRDVFLLHELLIQLLDAGHLLVVEPIGRLQHLQFIHHLGIQLAIVDLARVVNQLTVRNPDADVTTTAS